jgi:hypothetical protein
MSQRIMEEQCESDELTEIGLEGLEDCMPTWYLFRGLRTRLGRLYFLGECWAKREDERRLWEVTGREDDFFWGGPVGFLSWVKGVLGDKV